jgi:hypothetical protein
MHRRYGEGISSLKITSFWKARSMPIPQDEHPASDPKADCEALMNSVLPFAEQMLSSHGEFLPFGGAMRSSGELVSVAGYDGDERPHSADVIRLIKGGFIEAARQGQFKATALVYDVRIKLPSTDDKSDAIAVSLNHRDNYSIVVIFPYKIDSGKLTVGNALAQKGEADIFAR